MYIDNLSSKITSTENGYDVNYSEGEYSGTVSYVRYVNKIGKVMRNKSVYLIVSSDMGDIIECLHKKTPLTSEDFSKISMEIRTHSRSLVESFNFEKSHQV